MTVRHLLLLFNARPLGNILITMPDISSLNHFTDGSYEDCSTAAGLENRQITDNHVTASSFTSGHHPPQGRLNNVFKQVNDTAVWGSWCAGAEDMSQYIQVFILHCSRNPIKRPPLACVAGVNREWVRGARKCEEKWGPGEEGGESACRKNCVIYISAHRFSGNPVSIFSLPYPLLIYACYAAIKMFKRIKKKEIWNDETVTARVY